MFYLSKTQIFHIHTVLQSQTEPQPTTERLLRNQKDKMLKERGAYRLRLSRGYADHNCLQSADRSVAVACSTGPALLVGHRPPRRLHCEQASVERHLEGEPPQTHRKGGGRRVERPRRAGGGATEMKDIETAHYELDEAQLFLKPLNQSLAMYYQTIW